MENGYAIHAYVLMTNHVHLLLTPQATDSLPRAPCSHSAAATCAMSMRSIGGAERCGKGAIAPRADRWRGLFSGLLSLHRTQPGASPDGPTSARVSLVELSRPCARHHRPAAEQ